MATRKRPVAAQAADAAPAEPPAPVIDRDAIVAASGVPPAEVVNIEVVDGVVTVVRLPAEGSDVYRRRVFPLAMVEATLAG